jgi:hypothetical protein
MLRLLEEIFVKMRKKETQVQLIRGDWGLGRSSHEVEETLFMKEATELLHRLSGFKNVKGLREKWWRTHAATSRQYLLVRRAFCLTL